MPNATEYEVVVGFLLTVAAGIGFCAVILALSYAGIWVLGALDDVFGGLGNGKRDAQGR